MNSLSIKNTTSRRFSKWSKKYDKDLFQKLLFRNSHDMFLGEIDSDTAKSKRHVLDVGCGTGEFLSRLSGHKDEFVLHGVDLCSEMIEIASSKLKDKEASFKVGDVENLPYEDEKFDIITCSHSFHHYPDQKKAVSEMHRALKPNGKLMIIDCSKDSFRSRITIGFYDKFIEKGTYHMPAKELQAIFKAAGFKAVIQTTFNPLIPVLFTVGIKR
jgi:ubiquinone/menaquinone biosynthesis C-methylase UbiE